MNRHLRSLPLVLAGLLLTAHAMAGQAGWRQINVPGVAPQGASIPVALYYPTSAPARPIVMGPFTARVAP